MKGDLKKGSVVGDRYEIAEWINEGGMQHVYLAKDYHFDRFVALKSPKEDTAVKRFQQSAAVGALINHPNVAKTLDYVECGEKAYLIEELIDGLDLSQVVPQRMPYIPPGPASRLLHHLARGLAASHRVGVVHRDLKPSNVMVAGGPLLHGVKITDFGIATMAEGEIGPWAAGADKGTRSRTILGAIPYMAPESIGDFGNAGKPSDVWSIAAIVYELVSGSRPFGKGTDALAKILVADPPPLPEQFKHNQFKAAGTELYETLLSCFSKNPNDRITADELVQRCGALCYGEEQYELGFIKVRRNSYTGFITSESGRDLMYHSDSFYGDRTHAQGDRLWFARHLGGGNDRAMPIVKLPRTARS
ncbi:serine/threonine-protein kinase [Brevundimonas sp.]|uniref:serine/threonine-protein kinase n=1 Tax=Brevundimonas sp. TaxID=1871086 RepID=UPI0035ADCB5A